MPGQGYGGANRAAEQGVLAMLESPVIFLTPVDINHMVFITTGTRATRAKLIELMMAAELVIVSS